MIRPALMAIAIAIAPVAAARAQVAPPPPADSGVIRVASTIPWTKPSSA